MSEQGLPIDPSPDLVVLARRGVDLFEAYQCTGQAELAAESIAWFLAAFGAATDDDPRRAVLLTCISASTRALFERTRQMELLNGSLETGRAAVYCAIRGTPDHAAALSGLALALWASYKHDGALSALTEAVEVSRSAVQASAGDDPARGERLSNAAMVVLDHFEHTGRMDSLDEAQKLGRAGLAATVAEHRDYPQRLTALGNALMACFQYVGREEALSEAVELYRKALDTTPDGDSTRAGRLNNLASALRNQFAQAGRSEALREAIEVGRAAVAVTPVDHPDRAQWQCDLVVSLRISFESTGDVTALHEAIDTGRAAVAATPTQYPERAARLSVLENALYRWADYTGDIATIEEALEIARAAVAAIPTSHARRASMLSDLGSVARLLYSHTGRVEALIEAVESGRAAVESVPASSPTRPIYLNNLGINLRTLFERTGDETALTGAVEAGRAAVAATPPNHPQRIEQVTNLVYSLQRMYASTGQAALILEAVESAQNAVAATPEDFSGRAAVLQSLGNAFRVAYERSGLQQFLGEAARMLRDALEAIPADHSGRPGILNDLAITLQLFADHTDEHDALAAAYSFLQQALNAISPDHPDRIKITGNMAAVAMKISVREKSPEIGLTAVAALRAVAHALAETHPDRASRSCDLGLALKDLATFDESNAVDLLEEARECLRTAANSDAASVRVRITAGSEQAQLDLAFGDAPGAALESIERVVELIDQIAPGSLVRTDRTYQLALLAGLPALAAAAAVTAGRPDRAVELLERTRGLLAAETLGLRSPELSELHAAHAKLAQELDQARATLAALDQGPAEQRTMAHAAVTGVLDRIRAVPGFESFLRPGLADLRTSVKGGAVVWVNCHPTRCHALILTGEGADHVQHVPLPDLAYDKVIENSERVQKAYLRERTSRDALLPSGTTNADQTISQLLAWLWDSVAEPVLSALGYETAPTEDAGTDSAWPRIWWCPVGVMAGLPLHAAGHHDDPVDRPGGRRAVLDRVISSYTPTLLALRPTATRENSPSTATALVVSVPDTPGAPLPGAQREASALQYLLPDARILASPTRADVLGAMPQHRIVHFACHCDTDVAHPDQSHLLLSDHDVTPLTVADVIRLEVDADLAYLSACSTSVAAQQLADEALHVTGAFHLAGYRHVIGTLWPVIDGTAADLATDVYERLTQGSDTRVHVERAADALHQAVRALRDRRPTEPTLWAPYTHTGA